MPSSAEPTSSPGPQGWLALAAMLAVGSASVFGAGGGEALDWQPARALHEPWRAWTSAWVHLSQLHLAANLAGAALVGAFGLLARVGKPSVAAWVVAWPLTQAFLLLEPELAHYGGLSGVLHAGAVIAALHLVLATSGARRGIGVAVLFGVLAKVASEAPWNGPLLRHPQGWDIAVAPIAHVAGVVAGLVAGLAAEAWRRAALTIVRND